MASNGSHSAVTPAGLLLLDTIPAPLALPVVSVLGIFRMVEWNADVPPSLGTLVPIHFAASEPARVLRVGIGAQSAAALISGAVRIEYPRADALLSMPSLSRGRLEIFTEVVLANGKPFALVVNIDALLRMHRELGRYT